MNYHELSPNMSHRPFLKVHQWCFVMCFSPRISTVYVYLAAPFGWPIFNGCPTETREMFNSGVPGATSLANCSGVQFHRIVSEKK